MTSDSTRILDISWETILKIAAAAVFFYILYLIRDILIWIIFALIISVLFNPAIDFLRKFMPRLLAVTFVYVAVFGIIGLSIYLIIPIFIAEINQFSKSFPVYFEQISPFLRNLDAETFQNLERFTSILEGQLSAVSSNIFNSIGVIFGGIFSTVTILSMAIFLSLEEDGMEKMVRALTPKKYEAVVLNLLEKSQWKVSGWFGARILASVFIGLMTFLICYVLKIDYAVSFGLFGAVSNFVPIIGPLIAGAIMAVIIAANYWLQAVFFIAAFILIQQIEGNILTPILTKKFIGLSPVLVIIALLVGGKLWGLMGALLVVPMSGILFEFLKDFLKRRKEEKAVVL